MGGFQLFFVWVKRGQLIVSSRLSLHGPSVPGNQQLPQWEARQPSCRDSKGSLVQCRVGWDQSRLAAAKAFCPTGPRYDTRTIVWICLTLITGLVVLLLLLICKKR